MLEKALRLADEVMAEGRDRVLGLRTPDAHFSDLTQALTGLGEELSAVHGAPFRAITEGSVRGLNPNVKDEIYWIAKEALLNAFRHAQAKGIEAQFIYSDADLRVRIRDDGIGLDATVGESGLRPGHWGLKGTRERAEKIGAKLDIWSRAGAGTEMELTIPGLPAYRLNRAVGRWRLILQWAKQWFHPSPSAAKETGGNK
jgi:signal transduction histidine kinase